MLEQSIDVPTNLDQVTCFEGVDEFVRVEHSEPDQSADQRRRRRNNGAVPTERGGHGDTASGSENSGHLRDDASRFGHEVEGAEAIDSIERAVRERQPVRITTYESCVGRWTAAGGTWASISARACSSADRIRRLQCHIAG